MTAVGKGDKDEIVIFSITLRSSGRSLGGLEQNIFTVRPDKNPD